MDKLGKKNKKIAKHRAKKQSNLGIPIQVGGKALEVIPITQMEQQLKKIADKIATALDQKSNGASISNIPVKAEVDVEELAKRLYALQKESEPKEKTTEVIFYADDKEHMRIIRKGDVIQELTLTGGLYEQYEVRAKYGAKAIELPEKYKITITPLDESGGSDVKIPSDSECV